MIFKVILFIGLVVLDKGSQFQIVLTLLITFIQLPIHAYALPFAERGQNVLQFFGYSISAGIAFAGVILNFLDVVKELARRVGRLQEVDHVSSQIDVFQTVMTVVIIGGIGLYGFVYAIFLALEAWQNRALISKVAKENTDKIRKRMSSKTGPSSEKTKHARTLSSALQSEVEALDDTDDVEHFTNPMSGKGENKDKTVDKTVDKAIGESAGDIELAVRGVEKDEDVI